MGSKVENSPVHPSRLARSDQEARQTLQPWVITNIHQATGLEDTIEDPRHVSVQKGLSTAVREQQHGTRNVLADGWQRFELVARGREIATAHNHLPRKGLQRRRSSPPEADGAKRTLEGCIRRGVDFIPASESFEKGLEEAANR